MNKVKAGRDFEIESKRYLDNVFDKVIWLSKENRKSPFDFKCIKGNQSYFGDAKVSKKNYPKLKFSQKGADFIIIKYKESIRIIWKEDFQGNIFIEKNFLPQIQISVELRDFLLNKGSKSESYDEVIKRLVGFKK